MLVLVARDLGFSDLGCYGGELQTPCLDYLGKNGLRFTQAYHAGGGLSAGVALLTGYYPQHLCSEWSRPGDAAGSAQPSLQASQRPPWLRMLPEKLKASGYRCYQAGDWPLWDTPAEAGFEGRDAVSGGSADSKTEPARQALDPVSELLRAHAQNAPKAPFFVFATLNGLPEHAADPLEDGPRSGRFDAGREVVCRQRLERLWSFGMLANAELSGVAPQISGSDLLQRQGVQPSEFQVRMEEQAQRVERLDRQIGRILDEIKAMGAWNHTAVFFLSESSSLVSAGPGDAGLRVPVHTPLRESACGLHEAALATPLIVHWPAGIRARGDVREHFVHAVDLAPTLLKVAGAVPQKKSAEPGVPALDGVDLTVLLSDNKAPGPRPLWWEWKGGRAFRLGDWKWISPKDKPVELYYLREDRSEMRDLADVNFERVKEMEVQWTRMAGRFRQDAAQGPAESGKEPGR